MLQWSVQKSTPLSWWCRRRKIPKGKSEDTKGEIRRYQRGNQKIPKGQSEDTKGAIRRYQRGNQKILKGKSEDTKGAIRSRGRTDNAMTIRKEHTMIYKSLHRNLMFEQHEPTNTGDELMCSGRVEVPPPYVAPVVVKFITNVVPMTLYIEKSTIIWVQPRFLVEF